MIWIYENGYGYGWNTKDEVKGTKDYVFKSPSHLVARENYTASSVIHAITPSHTNDAFYQFLLLFLVKWGFYRVEYEFSYILKPNMPT